MRSFGSMCFGSLVPCTGYNEKAPNLNQILFSKPLPLFDDKNYGIFSVLHSFTTEKNFEGCGVIKA